VLAEGEWQGALWTLLANPDLRARTGCRQAGRRTVDARFLLRVIGLRLAALLCSVIEGA